MKWKFLSVLALVAVFSPAQAENSAQLSCVAKDQPMCLDAKFPESRVEEFKNDCASIEGTPSTEACKTETRIGSCRIADEAQAVQIDVRYYQPVEIDAATQHCAGISGGVFTKD